ncbi:phospholipase [Bacteroidia bacterium]|nr:phospholipase [Bacteroidia bacterium]
MKEEQEQKKVLGIVLSGGAARGFAHLGALQALEDNGIIADCISGASMGAVLGSIYASGRSPKEIVKFAKTLNYRRMYRPSLKGGLFKASFLRAMLEKLLKVDTFEKLKKPMFVVATNLNRGTSETFCSGKIIDKVIASASIPVFFPPVVIDGNTYVDGGVSNNLPTEPLFCVCTHIIGISVNSVSEWGQERLEGWEYFKRVMTMIVVNTEKRRKPKCHHFIEIKEAGNIGLMDFHKVEEFYKIGYEAVNSYIKQHPAMLDELAS